MRLPILIILTMLGATFSISNSNTAALQPGQLQPNTLCARNERVIFSCLLRRPAKIVSVCAAKNLTRETGYLQYRFGLPRKIELEFPKERQGSQRKFTYVHYFRAQVDLTEITFSVNDVDYSVFDEYNGEEKPVVSLQGVTVNKPETPQKETRLICSSKPKADFTDLQAVLENP